MQRELSVIMVLQKIKVSGNLQVSIGNGMKEMESMQQAHGNP